MAAARLGVVCTLLAGAVAPATPAAPAAAKACANRAYIANTVWMGGADPKANAVWVIDTTTHQVITKLPMTGAYFPVISSDGSKVYVSNSRGGTVSVIDAATNNVSTIALPANPIGVAVTPDGKRLLVTSAATVGGMFAPGSLRIIDLATSQVSAPITVGSVPERVAVSPNGKFAYLVNADKKLTVVDLGASKVLTSIPLLGNSFSMEVSPDGKRVYLALSRPNLIGVIDATTNKVERYVPVGTGPIGMTMSPDGRSLYITNRVDGSLQQLSLDTFEVKATKKIGERPGLVRLTGDGKFAYVVYSTDKYVGVIDMAEFGKGPPMPAEGYRGFPGEAKTSPLPEIAKIETGSPTSVGICL